MESKNNLADVGLTVADFNVSEIIQMNIILISAQW